MSARRLAYPFRVAGPGRLATVEVGSEAEIDQNAYIVLSTPIGSREDLPEFGIDSPVFDPVPASGLDLSDVDAALAEWEPRANVALTGKLTDDLIARVEARIA